MRLVVAALVLVAAVLGGQVAAGGGDFVPRRSADPCRPRPQPPLAAGLDALGERLVLTGLDGTACRTHRTREQLVLALGDPRTRARVDPEAVRAGLGDAVGRVPLPKVSELLPEALELSDLPGLAKTAINAIPDGAVDDLLPTGPLLRRAIGNLDVERALGDLEDPSALEPALRDAILDAAKAQILDGLPF